MEPPSTSQNTLNDDPTRRATPPFSLEWYRQQASSNRLSLETRHDHPLDSFTAMKVAVPDLPDTKPFPLAAPDYHGEEWATPTPYNTNYPHPLTAYTSPSVNSASVASSGYKRLMDSLDTRLLKGQILWRCGYKGVAPALSLDPHSSSGCGIPERLWFPLSQWAQVKVPTGSVLHDMQQPLNASRSETDLRTCFKRPETLGPAGASLPSNHFQRRSPCRYAKLNSLSHQHNTSATVWGDVSTKCVEENRVSHVLINPYNSRSIERLGSLNTVHETMDDAEVLKQTIPPIGSESLRNEKATFGYFTEAQHSTVYSEPHPLASADMLYTPRRKASPSTPTFDLAALSSLSQPTPNTTLDFECGKSIWL